VAELIDDESITWKFDLFRNTFTIEDAKRILSPSLSHRLLSKLRY